MIYLDLYETYRFLNNAVGGLRYHTFSIASRPEHASPVSSGVVGESDISAPERSSWEHHRQGVLQGIGIMVWLHQYHVVGRMAPEKLQKEEVGKEPQVYRMRIFAPNTVVAKSRFWFFLRQLKRVKKANGEIVSINEIHEADMSTVKNFGVWLRYKSRSDTVNMYKEYRDVTMTGAVEQMYMEMSGRHRARWSSIQVLKVAEVENEAVRRNITLQMLPEDLAFPLPHVRPRAAVPSQKATFRAKTPVTFIST